MRFLPLGGFAAGLALSRRFVVPMGMAIRTNAEFAHRMEEQMRPIIHLFTPIFFVMVGLSLNFHVIDWSSPFIWTFTFVLLSVAVLTKLVRISGGKYASTAVIAAVIFSDIGDKGKIKN